jgi:integrase
MGKISYDFSGSSFTQKGSKEAEKSREIYAIDTLKGIFSKQWENGIDRDAPIFKNVYNDVFRQASFDMGSLLGFSETELVKKGICFYSGRHTYKTILALGNAEKTADIDINFQEMFMGHNFNKKELREKGINEYAYNHLDAKSIGDTLLAQKGKEVLKVIDRYYL